MWCHTKTNNHRHVLADCLGEEAMTLLRTVTYWVRYCPKTRIVVSPYRYKKDAILSQRPGEVIVKMKGIYSPMNVKKLHRSQR